MTSLSSDLSQLAHLLNLSAEEASRFGEVAGDARAQFQLLADRVSAMANELEALALTVASLIAAVDLADRKQSLLEG